MFLDMWRSFVSERDMVLEFIPNRLLKIATMILQKWSSGTLQILRQILVVLKKSWLLSIGTMVCIYVIDNLENVRHLKKCHNVSSFYSIGLILRLL